MNQNKVFKIELCQEDAQRIINALNHHKDQCYSMMMNCNDELCKDAAYLEWSYVSELAYNMELILDVDLW